MQIDITFPSKIMIKDLNEYQATAFLKAFIKYAWLDHDVPEGARMVKEDKKLSLEKLPKGFSIDEAAEHAFKRGILVLERLGLANLYIKAIITKTTEKNPSYKVEIDKFEYEKDGNVLKSVVDKAIAEI